MDKQTKSPASGQPVGEESSAVSQEATQLESGVDRPARKSTDATIAAVPAAVPRTASFDAKALGEQDLSYDVDMAAGFVSDDGESSAMAATQFQRRGAKEPDETPRGKGAAQAPTPAVKSKLTQLGDFRLIKKLGEGGMGAVFMAQQVSLDR